MRRLGAESRPAAVQCIVSLHPAKQFKRGAGVCVECTGRGPIAASTLHGPLCARGGTANAASQLLLFAHVACTLRNNHCAVTRPMLASVFTRRGFERGRCSHVGIQLTSLAVHLPGLAGTPLISLCGRSTRPQHCGNRRMDILIMLAIF